MTLLAELRPSAFLKLDFANAYNNMFREAILRAVQERAPGLLPVARVLCGAESRHWWYDAYGHGKRISATRGVDQGCPLSPALFAIGLAPALDLLRAALRALDPDAYVFSYLDDIHVVVDPQHVKEVFALVEEHFTPLGLSLNASKSEAWRPEASGFIPLPPGVQRVAAMTVMGAASIWVPDDQARVPLGWAQLEQLAASHQHLVVFSTRLIELHRAGLSLHSALLLHRMWAGGTLTHHMRANVVSEEFAAKWDRTVGDFWEVVLERVGELDENSRAQIRLAGPLGGGGVPSVARARLPAHLGSWELCFHEVARILGCNSAAAFRDMFPNARERVEGAAFAIRSAGLVDYVFRWEAPARLNETIAGGGSGFVVGRTLGGSPSGRPFLWRYRSGLVLGSVPPLGFASDSGHAPPNIAPRPLGPLAPRV